MVVGWEQAVCLLRQHTIYTSLIQNMAIFQSLSDPIYAESINDHRNCGCCPHFASKRSRATFERKIGENHSQYHYGEKAVHFYTPSLIMQTFFPFIIRQAAISSMQKASASIAGIFNKAFSCVLRYKWTNSHNNRIRGKGTRRDKLTPDVCKVDLLIMQIVKNSIFKETIQM